MTIHREGKKTILLGTVFLIGIIAVSVLVIPNILFKILVSLPFIVVYLLILWFFRIPFRKWPSEDNSIISPADGKIVVIEKTNEPEYFNDNRIQISIFMSPLNVHQNVYPISGEVVYEKYHKGKYLVAWHPKSSTENERATVVVRSEGGTEILFRQIAGAVARRICCYAKPGHNAIKGREFGFIKFGSRVDIFLPEKTKIRCKVGDTCKAKETVLAELT
jgi:phosphatidylserine decarboxylase